VISLLRFVGILNAAVWCGSAIFLTVGLPAVFSPELKRLLTAPGVGFAAQAIIARFFLLQYCCGAIALAHLLGEWMYCGRPVRRFNLTLVLALLALALAGGLWAQPKMRTLHEIKYFGKSPQQQAQAAKEFAAWHATSESFNLLVITGLIIYLWRVSAPSESQRLSGFSKIRG
jgi:Domain of unknown function (DUF4149)